MQDDKLKKYIKYLERFIKNQDLKISRYKRQIQELEQTIQRLQNANR